jgi:formylglycine-generating enzyme required for sulfatase activity
MGEGATRHFVALPEDYYLGIYEITQGQLETAIASLQASVLDRTMDNADFCPAAGAITYTNIRGGNNWPGTLDHSFVNSWAYLQYIRNRVGVLFKVDLPTEAQWEYAARAGEYAAEYAHGSDLFAGFEEYAWCSSNVAESATLQEVGTRLPNRWGLYDMFGNASEWCLDNYRADYGMSLPEYDDVNFAGPATDSIPNGGNISNPDVSDKVVRGGSYKDGADGMKCSYRKHTYRGTTDSGKDIGFRLCAPAVYPY